MAKIELKTVGNVLVWVLSIVLAAAYLLESAHPKLSGSQWVVEQFESFGYSPRFRVLIGILEAAGAVLLLFPRMAFWGAGLLIVVMIGAAYTHVATGLGSSFHALRNLLLLALIAGARWKLAFGLHLRRSGDGRPAWPIVSLPPSALLIPCPEPLEQTHGRLTRC